MKKSILALALALFCAPLFAVCPLDADVAAQEPNGQNRVSRREARQAEYEKGIDDLILSGNYRFKPDNFRKEPAGMLQYIRNQACEITMSGSSLEIFLPYYTGSVAPYRLIMLNTTTNNIRDYSAVKDDDSWIITFQARLFAQDDYDFKIIVTPKTGHAELTLSVPFGITMTYNGYIMNRE